jgi:hypothetical protein
MTMISLFIIADLIKWYHEQKLEENEIVINGTDCGVLGMVKLDVKKENGVITTVKK